MVKKKDFIILRVYSGIHKDIEVVIDDNKSYLIGSSVEDDIIFYDDKISKNHTKIVIRNKKLFIVPLNGKVSVGSNNIFNEEFVDFHTPVILDDVVISFRLFEHKPSVLNVDDILTKSKSINNNSSKHDKNGDSKHKSVKKRTVIHGFLYNFKKRCSGIWGSFAGKCKKTFSYICNSLNTIVKLLLFLILLIILFIFILLTVFSNFRSNNKIEDISLNSRELVVKNIESKFPEVKVSKDKSGNNVISGYVENKNQKKDLNKLVKDKGFYSVKVGVAKDIVSMANDAVINAGYENIDISYDKDGSVTVTGLVENEDQRKNIEGLILSDVSTIKNVKNSLIPIKNVGKEISSISIGKNPYIKLKSGRKLYSGSEIRPGIIVDKIQCKSVVFIYKGEKFTYNFVSGKVILSNNKEFF